TAWKRIFESDGDYPAYERVMVETLDRIRFDYSRTASCDAQGTCRRKLPNPQSQFKRQFVQPIEPRSNSPDGDNYAGLVRAR
ncbi:MAG: hypothetical protein AB8G99_22305, partial [Planctomycetaceae bacterium]